MSTTAENLPSLEFLLDVPIKLTVELGSSQISMRDLLQLNVGSVVQLDKSANASVDLYVNQKLVARGEVVVVEENFGIKIAELMAKTSGA